MYGAGEQYVAPFVILGGSGLWQVVAIVALPLVAGGVVQRLAAAVTDACGRRQPVFVAAASVQVLLWGVFAAAIYVPAGTQYWVMLATFILFIAGHHFSAPPWFSTMGDLVPESYRGRYFGWRNFLCGLAMIAAMLAAGQWLGVSERNLRAGLLGLSGRDFGFLALFLVAGVARGVSVYYLTRMTEPPYHAPHAERFTFWQFLRRTPHSQFGRFAVYRALIFAGQTTLLAFLSWQMLGPMQLAPSLFAVVVTAQFLASYGSQPIWGRLADRFGSKWALAMGGLGMSATPVLLMLGDQVWWLVVVQLYEGTALAASSMGAGNYLLDIVTPAKRARCSADLNIYIGLATLLAGFGGAALAVNVVDGWPLPWRLAGVTVAEPFTLILLASTALRVVPNVLLLPTFHEARLGRASAGRRRSAGPGSLPGGYRG